MVNLSPFRLLLPFLFGLVRQLVGEHVINVAGNDYSPGPLIDELEQDFADGQLTGQEEARLANALLLVVLSARKHQPLVIPGAPVTITTPPIVTAPPPVAPPPSGPPSTGHKVDEITGGLSHIEQDRDAPDADRPGIAGKIVSPSSHVLMVKERAHFNFNAIRSGQPVADEEVRTWYLPDGHSPIAQPEWGYLRDDGTEEVHTNSRDHEDAFELQAYDKKSSPNAGWTFVLMLVSQRGPGQGRAFARLVWPAAANGGIEVRSPRTVFQTD